jgi:hypothetical protein
LIMVAPIQQPCGFSKMHLVCVHAAFRVSALPVTLKR